MTCVTDVSSCHCRYIPNEGRMHFDANHESAVILMGRAAYSSPLKGARCCRFPPHHLRRSFGMLASFSLHVAAKTS